jgi:hypothetical protein
MTCIDIWRRVKGLDKEIKLITFFKNKSDISLYTYIKARENQLVRLKEHVRLCKDKEMTEAYCSGCDTVFANEVEKRRHRIGNKIMKCGNIEDIDMLPIVVNN